MQSAISPVMAMVSVSSMVPMLHSWVLVVKMLTVAVRLPLSPGEIMIIAPIILPVWRVPS